jgi:hypothetical protein
VTGVSFRTEGLTGKQVELALQMIPDVAKIGYLVNVASGIIRRGANPWFPAISMSACANSDIP